VIIVDNSGMIVFSLQETNPKECIIEKDRISLFQASDLQLKILSLKN